MSNFISKFAPSITSMLEYRVALGLSENTGNSQLKKFDSYCANQFSECETITKELVFVWLNTLFEAGITGINSYASAVRNLAEYINAIGQPAYVLPSEFYPHKSGFTAYVFSDMEMSALFTAIDSLPNSPKNNEAVIAPVLFRLIYTCGLRPNEGRLLKRKNINFNNGEIKIAETKKKKERLVVMSLDMLNLCLEFDIKYSSTREYFFTQLNDKPYTSSQVDNLIKKCWRNANPNIENLPNVRTYDLRHRFASTRLNRWLDEGANLKNKLVYLMTYMGHGHINETRYYIHILPENLIKSSGVDWGTLNSIIPEAVSVCR